MSFIPYGRQCITDADIEAVVKTLKSDFLTQGSVGTDFEDKTKEVLKVPHAFSCNSATSGLQIAYEALGFSKGDILWTSPNTFVATSNMALTLGGSVDFVDIDNGTFCMCMKTLEDKLIEAKSKNILPKIVVPVHFAGQSCDMKKLRSLANTYKFFIVEDAAHAIGATYENQPIGSCKYSDISVFSFHPVKIITTGEGGLVTTANSDLAKKIQALRSHGVTKDTSTFSTPADGPWSYEQQSLGYNFRMCDIQSALGLSQINEISTNISNRQKIADTYHKELSGLPIKWQKPNEDGISSWHLFVITCNNSAQRLELFNHLRENNIGVQVHYIPVHTQPYYKTLGFTNGMYPNAEDYYSRCISIPMYHNLTNEDQMRVIHLLREFFKA